MTKGFLVFAQNSKYNYVDQACLLALSIQATTPNSKISIVTNDTVPDRYKKYFDKIIPIEEDLASKSEWKIENRVCAYDLTPYDQTVVLDTDMVFLDNFKPKWDWLSNYELYFCNHVKTFRSDPVTSRYYRQAFDANFLPDIYSGIYYFTKNSTAERFFTTLKKVLANWQNIEMYKKQQWPSIDLACAITSELLDVTPQITSHSDTINFVHMKPHCQDWPYYNKPWMDISQHYLTDNLELYIGGSRQKGIFHYTEKEFCDQEKLEKYYGAVENTL